MLLLEFTDRENSTDTCSSINCKKMQVPLATGSSIKNKKGKKRKRKRKLN